MDFGYLLNETSYLASFIRITILCFIIIAIAPFLWAFNNINNHMEKIEGWEKVDFQARYWKEFWRFFRINLRKIVISTIIFYPLTLLILYFAFMYLNVL
jgi:ABC-type spermidine/putrescine transport system permease subunit I